MSGTRSLYRIAFINQGKVYEIYCHRVSQDGLFGFVMLEDITFGERATVVVDPAEERLRNEFAGVRRTYVPLHAVVRIDEVERQGEARISPVEQGNVMPFPGTYLPNPSDKKP
jgi:hypothetical protein